MDTALIVVIAVIAVVLLFLVARRAWNRGIEARREKAGELRVESTRRQERARRAEIEAEREREAAETTGRRADRIDPDVERPRRFMRRNRDDEVDEDRNRDDEVGEDRDRDDEVDEDRDRSRNGERPGLWDRLVHR